MGTSSSHQFRRILGTAVVWSIAAGCWGSLDSTLHAFQLLPPPGDREIRSVLWELRNESEVWLTLEPSDAKGHRAPLLTFTQRFPGRVPPQQATDVDVRAYAGMFWSPRVEFWLLLDDTHKIDLVSPFSQVFGLIQGTPSNYLSETIPIATLKQIASARRITGNALGFDFELTSSQRAAIAAFLERVESRTPVRARNNFTATTEPPAQS